MPTSAIANVSADAIVPSGAIADTIAAMVQSDDPPPGASARSGAAESQQVGPASLAVCPECGGVLSERNESGVVQWHCHVGHRYSSESLADAQAAQVEAALWTAVRALQERAAVMDRMAEQSEQHGRPRSADSFRSKAADARRQAQMVRGALHQAAANALRSLSSAEGEAVAGKEAAS
jgi:two-component system chemotaxis response regulator CheB